MSTETHTTQVSSGLGLPGATFIVFLVMKLTGYIDWSWWWVTAPLWGALALVAAIFIIVMIIIVLTSAAGGFK